MKRRDTLNTSNPIGTKEWGGNAELAIDWNIIGIQEHNNNIVSHDCKYQHPGQNPKITYIQTSNLKIPRQYKTQAKK